MPAEVAVADQVRTVISFASGMPVIVARPGCTKKVNSLPPHESRASG
jgi:hypothetical protein